MIIDVLSLFFLIIVFILFWLIKCEWRRVFLLLSCFAYVGYIDKKALIFVLVTSALFYFGGKIIEKKSDAPRKSGENDSDKAKSIYYFLIIMAAISLIVFKYGHTIATMGIVPESLSYSLVVPIGYSFYILGSISYISDIYLGKRKAETSLFNYILYMCWFPKFVSGPIEDEKRISGELNKINEYRLTLDNCKLAFYRILYGIFVKLVVADRIGLYVNDLYNNKESFGSVSLLFGTILYSMQIYFDFCGYTTLARGVSTLFGVELSENFKTPYCAENISEFWRRWHMSLSTWLKNYIYIPLGGNKKGEARKVLNLIIVFLVSGFWHGATLAFIVWGLLHGIYSVINAYFQKKNISFFTKGMSGRIITFIEVSFAWIFFRAGSIKEAINYIKCMCTNGIQMEYLKSHFNQGLRQAIDPALAIGFMMFLIILDVISYRKNKEIPELICEFSRGKRILVLYGLVIVIFVFGNYGASILEKTLIYMQF